MRKIYFGILSVFVFTVCTFAQILDVTTTYGDVEEYNLSDIDNIAFSLDTTSKSDTALELLSVHTSGGLYQILDSEIDSMYFNTNNTTVCFQTVEKLVQFDLADIDSITFSSISDSTVYIAFNNSMVSVINTFDTDSISVDISKADVTVTSTSETSNVNYVLSGATSDGMFKIYSDKKIVLTLDGIEITNNDGPAINIQTSKKVTVNLVDGSANVLSDGENYSDAVNEEDQDAAFFSEGQLIFEGSGSLEINGYGTDQHGLASDDYIEVNDGSITINSAEKDGIHVKDGFFMNGGAVDISSNGDGIDGDENIIEINDGTITVLNNKEDKDAIKTDSTIVITGGTIELEVEGDMAKGLTADQGITFNGGVININASGDVVLEESGLGYDPSYCTAIKSDSDVLIDNAVITIVTTGKAGRGISIKGDLTMTSGTLDIRSSGDGAKYTNEEGVADAYHGPAIKADGDIHFVAGSLTINHSGDAGKAVSCDGNITLGSSDTEPEINITTTGNSVSISGDTRHGDSGESAEAKAIKADNVITVESGNITISSADDGIKSETQVMINGGSINITDSYEGIESPILHVNGGNVIVSSSDDAFNTTYGNGGETNDGSDLTINDGYVCLNSTRGDALDSNGDLTINGGTVIVHGTDSDPEVGVDVNGDFLVNGGFFVVSGTNNNMLQSPIGNSAQYSVTCKANQSISAGSLFHIEDDSGNNLVTFAPKRKFYSIIFSSSQLANGKTYKIYTGGSSTGNLENGLYTNGTYSGGTLKKTFTLSSKSQVVSF